MSRSRKKAKSVLFTLIAVPAAAIMLLAGIEGLARLFLPSWPAPSRRQYVEYHPLLGWLLAKGETFHVTSEAKGIDMLVQVGELGFRDDGGEKTPASAGLIVIGDSHAFGYGLRDEDTLASRLRQKGQKTFNAGIPGFGYGQFLLCCESLDELSPGCTVLVFTNPMNDLVNLSSSIDYWCPKPHALVISGRLLFTRPEDHDPQVPYRFSPLFETLNEVFDYPNPAPWPFRWKDHLALFSLPEALLPSRRETIPLMWDRSTAVELHEAMLRYASDNALQEASRCWPEISRFASERAELLALFDRVLLRMRRWASDAGVRLLFVVNHEADRNHPFERLRTDAFMVKNPEFEFQWGWSKKAVLDRLRACGVETIEIVFPADSLEEMYLPCDSHVSAKGFAFIAEKVAGSLGRRP